jgi:hypothetical protein
MERLAMFIGALRAQFQIPGARSLKSKRAPLRSLKDRVRQRFGVTVAEVDAQDLHQRTVVGLALVSGEEKALRVRLAELRRYLERDPDLRCLGIESRVVRFDEAAGDDDLEAPADLLFMDLRPDDEKESP